MIPLDLTALELSNRLGVPVEKFLGILEGTEPITGEIADCLGRCFDNPSSYWTDLQQDYDEELALRKSSFLSRMIGGILCFLPPLYLGIAVFLKMGGDGFFWIICCASILIGLPMFCTGVISAPWSRSLKTFTLFLFLLLYALQVIGLGLLFFMALGAAMTVGG